MYLSEKSTMQRLVLFSFCFCLLQSTFGQEVLDDLNDVSTDFNVMGMSVIALCDGEIDVEYYAGLRDFTRQLPVNSDTQYRIASISKAITATGLMLLVDQGAVSLNADISEYLGFEARNPLFPNTPITVEMVLSHRSGIQDGTGYNGFLNATYSAENDLPALAELLLSDGAYFTSNIWRNETPGTYFAYSNLNYGVIATIIEAASNERFDLFMEANVFEPLGLHCAYNPSLLDDIDNLAVIYRNQGGWAPQVDNYQGNTPEPANIQDYIPGGNGLRFAPQGGLRASARDLARLMQLHINNGYDNLTQTQLISADIIELMHTPIWTYNGSNGDNYFNLFNSWGLGVQITTNTSMGDIVFDGFNMIGHAGEAYGLVSDWYFHKETGRGIIFMNNGVFSGYNFGETSAFYTVEEAVFDAVEPEFIACTTGIFSLAKSADNSIFPNPIVNGDVLNSTLTSGYITVWNLQGKHVLSNAAFINGQITLPELESGTYIVQLITSKGSQMQRLLVLQ
jgi:CubicO group peptidase (beta-lactamase class C family)